MKKIIRNITIILVSLILVILFFAGWYFSSQVMYPEKGMQCDEKHFVYCNDPRQDLSLEFEEVVFISQGQSQEQIKLHGWFIPRKGSKRAIITVHGHGANRYEGARWFKTMHAAGFNILSFDLRNSGQSTAGFTSMGYHEKHDVIAAVDFLTRDKGMQTIGVFGVSMGSSTSILAMAQDQRIKAGVFEATLANLRDEFSDILIRDFGLPEFPLLQLAILFLEMRAELNVDELNPEDIIGKIAPRPVFLIHCEHDPYIEYKHGQRMFRAAGQPNQNWTSSCSEHAEAWQPDPAEAERRVTDFFKKHLSD